MTRLLSSHKSQSVAIVVDITTPVLPLDLVAAFIVVPNVSIEISNHTQRVMQWYLLNALL